MARSHTPNSGCSVLTELREPGLRCQDLHLALDRDRNVHRQQRDRSLMRDPRSPRSGSNTETVADFSFRVWELYSSNEHRSGGGIWSTLRSPRKDGYLISIGVAGDAAARSAVTPRSRQAAHLRSLQEEGRPQVACL